MNRQTLADATSLHDGAVPIYLMQEIANGTKASERDAEKTADFLLGRLAKTNLIVKLKALQIMAFCIREGDPVFAEVMREEEAEIQAYLQYSGPPDPVMGDERYRRVRVASQEVLVCLNDGCLPRRNDAPPAPANGGPWGAPSAQQQPQQQAPQYGGAPNAYGQPGGYGAPSAPAQPSGPWGNNSASGSRPAPYSDSPSSGPSYGGSGGYGGPQQGQDQHNSGYGGGGYGNDANQHQQHQQHQQHGHGLGSWSNPAPSVPSYGAAPKAAGGGMWTSSGYQKSAPPPPSYSGGASFSSRDNRPTVLVGHNLNFPKPPSHGNSSLIGGVGGTSSGTYGGPSGGSGYGGPSGGAYGGQGAGGFGGNSGGFGGNSGGFGGNSGSSMGGFGGASSRQTPSYIENMNRMLSNPSGGGFSGGGGGMHGPNAGPSTKIGKAVVSLKKIGVEAKDRWDRRNMDKSIGASLADHDELNAGPTVMDRGYFQPHSQQVTGGKDTSGAYERGLIDSLCESAGLARAPPADALKRFVELAQTLDVQTICDILLDKLEDSVWQVRLKALHVVVALLESPGSAPYMELFEDNAGVLEELREDAKPTVAQKALQVMRVLGLADESTPEPTRRAPARSTPSRSAPPQQSGGGGDVDFLGFDSLSINAAPQQTPTAPNIYATPPSAARQAPPPPEVSLLDGFDPVPQQPNAQYHQQQQQQQQQQQYGDLLLQSPQRQAPMDDRSKTLSNFGKDLFTIANSPRSSGNGDATNANAERSAFNFM